MIPNCLRDVEAARDKYPTEWAAAHVDGHPLKHAFILKLASDLNAKNPNVGCNGKRGNPDDLSMDALNVLDEEDGPGFTPAGKRCWVVDVIHGAGGPNPKPIWNAFSDSQASSGAWVHPKIAGLPPLPPTPMVLPKGDAFMALKALDAFYRAPEGLQRPEGIGGDMEAIAQWFYQLVIERVPLNDVFAQIRASHEWRSKHGEL